MSNLQQEIRKTLEAVRQLEKVESHLSQLESRLDLAYEDQNKLAKVLEKEYTDYEQLEKLSLKSLFHKMLGSKEEQMEKERQEYLQASLKFDEHKKSVELMEYEQKVLREKLGKNQGLQAQLDDLLKKREMELLRENGPKGKQLLHIQKQIDHHQLIIWEVKEAITAGQEAAFILEEMIGFLRTARNWGQWNRGGRGRSGSHFKHSNIDRARERAYLAQQLLNRFEDELRDIYTDVERFNLNLTEDAFGRFLDVFFGNLITDWIIQQKIQNALANVGAVRERVLRLLEGLRVEELNSQSVVKAFGKQRKSVLSES